MMMVMMIPMTVQKKNNDLNNRSEAEAQDQDETESIKLDFSLLIKPYRIQATVSNIPLQYRVCRHKPHQSHI